MATIFYSRSLSFLRKKREENLCLSAPCFSLNVSLIGGAFNGWRRRVCSHDWRQYIFKEAIFMDIADDLWHLSEQVRSLWMSIPVQLEFCRWRGMTRAAPPWERKNGRQMRQAREISQTRLFLQIFRPNLNEKIKPQFFLVVLINSPFFTTD